MKYYPDIVLCFHPSETYYPNGLEVMETSGHCEVAESFLTYNFIEYIYLEYEFVYEANSAIGCGYCCFPTSECLGYHEGDREHVIMLLDKGTFQVKHVFFKAHGKGQGVWLPWEECEKTYDGKLKVYVARGSHACYPHPQTYIRIFGLANDLCSDRGRYVTFRPNGSYESDYHPQITSITFCERFFLPFLLTSIRNK
jgi:hypothetical protein